MHQGKPKYRTYLEKTLKSFPGVFGPLVSCTVSNVGAPLAPLFAAFESSADDDVLNSCSRSCSISGSASVDDVGVAL